jgi:tetratricopeptide (TPR) repeat protein
MDTEWFCHLNGKNCGPLSSQQLRDAAKKGYIKPTDLIWKRGLKTWLLSSYIKGLFSNEAIPKSANIYPANLPPLPTLSSEASSAHSPYPNVDSGHHQTEYKLANEPKQDFLAIRQRKCPNCGAKVQIHGASEKMKCEYCDTEFAVIRPVSIKKSLIDNSDKAETKRFSNLIKILETALIAENYKEAYEYCNKALEIDPDNGAIWENKALSTLYLHPISEIDESLTQITACMDAAESINPKSPTLQGVSKTVSDTIYFCTTLWIHSVSPDLPNNMFSAPLSNNILSKVKTWEQCYQIHNDLTYLKGMVDELSGKGKINWPAVEKKIPTAQLRQRIINIIRRKEPGYTPPKISQCFVITATFGDHNHPTVLFLKYFRDSWLEHRIYGQQLIQAYYKIGPSIAGLIEKFQLLKIFSYYFIVLPSVFVAKCCMYISKNK